MNDESLEQIEKQITSMTPAGASAALRSAVMDDVRRELSSGAVGSTFGAGGDRACIGRRRA